MIMFSSKTVKSVSKRVESVLYLETTLWMVSFADVHTRLPRAHTHGNLNPPQDPRFYSFVHSNTTYTFYTIILIY